jgi:hypothetical protein
MNRRAKRLIKIARQKALRDKKPYDMLILKGARVFTIFFSLGIVLLSLFSANRDNSIPESELSTIDVTLRETPKYVEIKSRFSGGTQILK